MAIYLLSGAPEGNLVSPSDLKLATVGVVCDDCGYRWLWEPKRSEFNGSTSNWTLYGVAPDRWVLVDDTDLLECPSCSEIVHLYCAIHESGAVIIANPEEYLIEDEWWGTDEAP